MQEPESQHAQDHGEPQHAPPGLPLEQWTTEHHLAELQATNAARRARRAASSYKCNGETDPRRARAAFMANPHAVMTVNGRRFYHRHRADDRLQARQPHLRRPSCNTRRQGTGRPARRSTRRTTRTSARSGSSGPSGSDAPGDAGPPHAHLTPSPTLKRGSGA